MQGESKALLVKLILASVKVQPLQSLPQNILHDTQHIVNTIALVNRMKVTEEMKKNQGL